MCAKKRVSQLFKALAHQINLRFAPAGALQQAGTNKNVVAYDEFRLATPRVTQHALEGLLCLASSIGDALAMYASFVCFGIHGLAQKADQEQIHNRNVDNLANYDVESLPGV